MSDSILGHILRMEKTEIVIILKNTIIKLEYFYCTFIMTLRISILTSMLSSSTRIIY